MKILVVDDHTLVRIALAQLLLSCSPGSDITEAADAKEATAVLREHSFDVALVDIRMPGRSGLELVDEIARTRPGLPMIVVTDYDDPEYARAAMSAGAAGYLLKDSGPVELYRAIAEAVSGAGTVVSPRAARGLTKEARATGGRTTRERMPKAGLTRREMEILALLCDGSSNREISGRLVLSEKTVKGYLVSAFGKLGVSNRTQAAILAVSMGIGTLPGRDGLPASRLRS